MRSWYRRVFDQPEEAKKVVWTVWEDHKARGWRAQC
jgi:hypothetical protein